MLEDLSAHILDIAQNSVAAGAENIEVSIRKTVRRRADAEKKKEELRFVEFEIADDGKGMDASRVAAVVDPFCTSRTTRRVGMGLPFLKQNAELCGGKFEISSLPGRGTRVFASFDLSSIDTPPLGDLAGSFLTLLIDAPRIHWVFRYETPEASEPFVLDSRDVAEALDGLESLRIPRVAMELKSMMEKAIHGEETNVGMENDS